MTYDPSYAHLQPVSTRLAFERIVERFPAHEALIRRLALSDSAFRGMCEDHGAACASLAWFQSDGNADTAPRIAEFTQLVQELEREIAEAIDRSRG